MSTVTKWMVDAGIWQTRAKSAARAFQPRRRRECLGELVQVDGCDHHWFEDRGPRCTLLVFIDDATGRLMELHFAESESTFDYFTATRNYIQRHGRPVALAMVKQHQVERDAKLLASKAMTYREKARFLAKRADASRADVAPN